MEDKKKITPQDIVNKAYEDAVDKDRLTMIVKDDHPYRMLSVWNVEGLKYQVVVLSQHGKGTSVELIRINN